MELFGPDNFTIKSKDGADVAVKYLKDNKGNYILNREGTPYVVPADFDLHAVMAKYSPYDISEGILSPTVPIFGSEKLPATLLHKLQNATQVEEPAISCISNQGSGGKISR